MGRKLYVGKWTFDVTDRDLHQLFQTYGTVQSGQVISDRERGRNVPVNEVRPWTEGGAGSIRLDPGPDEDD